MLLWQIKMHGAYITGYSAHVSGSCVWSLVFVCDVFVGDVNLVHFLSKPNRMTVKDSPYDSVRWDLTSKVVFTSSPY